MEIEHDIYGDNQSMLYNTALSETIMKKKSQSICYHFLREGPARDEWRTGYIKSVKNPADVLTKPLSAVKRQALIQGILYHIYNECEMKGRVEGLFELLLSF